VSTTIDGVLLRATPVQAAECGWDDTFTVEDASRWATLRMTAYPQQTRGGTYVAFDGALQRACVSSERSTIEPCLAGDGGDRAGETRRIIVAAAGALRVTKATAEAHVCGARVSQSKGKWCWRLQSWQRLL